MKCRPATSDDIPEMTRIITEGFLDYPLHIMLKPYLYQPDHYPQCVTAIKSDARLLLSVGASRACRGARGARCRNGAHA